MFNRFSNSVKDPDPDPGPADPDHVPRSDSNFSNPLFNYIQYLIRKKSKSASEFLVQFYFSHLKFRVRSGSGAGAGSMIDIKHC